MVVLSTMREMVSCPPVSRSSFILLALVAAAAGYDTTETQWYKPSRTHVAEPSVTTGMHEEGRARGLHEAAGWISLSGNVPPKPKTLEEQERERHGSTGSSPVMPSKR